MSKLSSKERIEILEEQVKIFYKWFHYWQRDAQIKSQKHDAIKVQNFEMAVKYRDEEKANYVEWEKANQELLKHLP